MRKILLVFLFFISTSLVACSKGSNDMEVYFVKNDGAYESYVGANHQDVFLLNLAFNYSPSLAFDQSVLKSIELLPKTDIAEITEYKVVENPPQGNLKQKALMIHMKSKKKGTHTFNQISFDGQFGKKTFALGAITININEGEFSGVVPLSQTIGVFPVSTPLEITPKNASNYPITIKDFKINNPHIKLEKKDIKILKNNVLIPLPPEGYTLKPDEKTYMKIDWRIEFPKDDILNIEARPLLVSEKNGKVEYAGVPNGIFRNDFAP
ncbi:hypothetical protein C4A75_07405 [Brevibacillus laterosporus]|uniref:hypothetical protein n=1 Tax=Brevibacillus laterosporus TaxID=1465 RepID=UPI000CE575A2|nr:hypothetical protein [Brevibacillus laterosporus]PPA85500.1 hypothetical protein C4A75_07405 [Brevibacillus laterosporus]